MLVILKIAAGALISIFFVIYLEKKKLPKLQIKIEDPHLDLNYPPGRPATRHKALRVIVSNQKLHPLLNWFLSRSASLNCRALISFHHLDGQNFFGRTMNGRWASTPQPIPLRGKVGNEDLILFDDMRLSQTTTDIYAGDEDILDIGARFDLDIEAYGWSNDSYFCDPMWKPNQWLLPPNRYLVKVQVISSNSQFSKLFRLINDVTIDDFRLEPAQAGDRA